MILFSSEPASKQRTLVLYLAKSAAQSQSGGLSSSDHLPPSAANSSPVWSSLCVLGFCLMLPKKREFQSVMVVVLCPTTRNIHVSRDADSRQRTHYEDRQFQEPRRLDSHLQMEPKARQGTGSKQSPHCHSEQGKGKKGSSRRQGAVTQAGKEADSTNMGQDLSRKVSMAFWPYRSL